MPRRKEELKAAREKRAKELKRGPGVSCSEKSTNVAQNRVFWRCVIWTLQLATWDLHRFTCFFIHKVCGLFQISSVSGGRFGARRLQLSDCRNWSKLFGWIAVDLGTQTSAGSTFCRPLSDCSIYYIYIYIIDRYRPNLWPHGQRYGV